MNEFSVSTLAVLVLSVSHWKERLDDAHPAVSVAAGRLCQFARCVGWHKCGGEMTIAPSNEQDIIIVMRYTGWSRETAINAIRQYRAYDPDWNADYIKVYLERGE